MSHQEHAQTGQSEALHTSCIVAAGRWQCDYFGVLIGFARRCDGNLGPGLYLDRRRSELGMLEGDIQRLRSGSDSHEMPYLDLGHTSGLLLGDSLESYSLQDRYRYRPRRSQAPSW
jgi:hypothetical protein